MWYSSFYLTLTLTLTLGLVMKIILLLIFSFVTIGNVVKAQDYGNAFVEKVVSVYDGDTFRVNLIGYPPLIGENIAIRVNGIDTPEIRGKCAYEKELAKKARDYTRALLSEAKSIRLQNIERGKYFRIAADVYVDGINLGKRLINANLAYVYDAGKKQSWCNV